MRGFGTGEEVRRCGCVAFLFARAWGVRFCVCATLCCGWDCNRTGVLFCVLVTVSVSVLVFVLLCLKCCFCGRSYVVRWAALGRERKCATEEGA